MTTKLEIANQALLNIGITSLIKDIDNDNTQEAKIIRLYYDSCLNEVNRLIDWGFLRKEISLMEKSTDDGKIIYKFPDDCIRVLGVFPQDYNLDDNIITYGRSSENRALSFRVFKDENGDKVISSYLNNAKAFYIKKIDDISTITDIEPYFVEALSWCISSKITVPLSGSIGLNDSLQIKEFIYDKVIREDAENENPSSPFSSSYFLSHINVE